MAFCNNCGGQVDDNATVCPNCGAQQNQNQNNTYVAPNPTVNNAAGADFTAQYDINDIQQNKIMAVLAYIGILFLIPLLAAPNSRFARFHANQGLVLFIFDIVVGIVSGVLTTLLAFIPIAGWILSGIVGFVLWALILVMVIIGIVNAATGKAKELPVIGKISIIK